MASNPQLNVRIAPHIIEFLDVIAKRAKRTRASIIAGLLEGLDYPAFRRIETANISRLLAGQRRSRKAG